MVCESRQSRRKPQVAAVWRLGLTAALILASRAAWGEALQGDPPPQQPAALAQDPAADAPLDGIVDEDVAGADDVLDLADQPLESLSRQDVVVPSMDMDSLEAVPYGTFRWRIPSYVTMDLRLAWVPNRNLEVAVVGQNLLNDQHPEFGHDVNVLSTTEVRRSVFAKAT